MDTLSNLSAAIQLVGDSFGLVFIQSQIIALEPCSSRTIVLARFRLHLLFRISHCCKRGVISVQRCVVSQVTRQGIHKHDGEQTPNQGSLQVLKPFSAV